MEKSTPLWYEDCRFFPFETGLGKPMLTLNDPNGLKNGTNVYSINLELQMALPWQTSTGKWKYVNPDLDFLGIPDQSTAYVKRQARPGWTYVRRSSVTPDLFNEWTTLSALRPRQMAAISQTIFSNTLYWMKIYAFRLRFHLILFQLAIFQHWLRLAPTRRQAIIWTNDG